jgi:hypothetical protein
VEEIEENAAEEPVDGAMVQLVTGVGQVCISASALEWGLTYLTGVLAGWEDPEFARVLGRPGQPLREYQNLVPRLEAFGLGRDASQLAADAERLLSQRHRVAHSVMLAGTRADNECLYEAWHARTDTTWPVMPGDLSTLATDLALCAAEATSFAQAWQERAERDGWPDLSALADQGSPPMRELADGVAFWRNRAKWPDDFHNTDYETLARENPHGNFTPEWWPGLLKTLNRWKATRGSSDVALTARFSERAAALSAAWQQACVPFLDRDISTVTWEQVGAFPELVAEIKPTKVPSPVFTSKFSHFLLPRVFPVVDNWGLGNRWPTYEAYFRFAQQQWEDTDRAARDELVAELTRLIEATGQEVSAEFPMVTKIIELRLIGRRHPGGR